MPSFTVDLSLNARSRPSAVAVELVDERDGDPTVVLRGGFDERPETVLRSFLDAVFAVGYGRTFAVRTVSTWDHEGTRREDPATLYLRPANEDAVEIGVFTGSDRPIGLVDAAEGYDLSDSMVLDVNADTVADPADEYRIDEDVATAVDAETVVAAVVDAAETYQANADERSAKIEDGLRDARTLLEHLSAGGTLSEFAIDRSREELDSFLYDGTNHDWRLQIHVLETDVLETTLAELRASSDDETVKERYRKLVSRGDAVGDRVVELVRDHPDERARKGLLILVWGREPDEAPEAIRALAKIPNDTVIDELTTCVTDADDPEIRLAAAEGLGEIGPDAAVEALREATDDENEHVRSTAQAALATARRSK